MPIDLDNLGEPRAAFIGRVRRVLERDGGAPPGPPPAVDPQLARLASEHDDLLTMFAERAAAVGMKVHRLRSDAVVAILIDVLRALDAKRLGVAAGAVARQFDLEPRLSAAGFALLDWPATVGLDPQYELDAGVTDVHAALAETGTLVCASDAAHTRGLSLVPPAHVAIVRRSDVLPDLIDFYARYRGIPGSELPSSIAFITGPSKTADIEGELITGVHGPGHVHILLVEDA